MDMGWTYNRAFAADLYCNIVLTMPLAFPKSIFARELFLERVHAAAHVAQGFAKQPAIGFTGSTMHSDMSPSSASTSATVAFIDLAGFSAIADVYGDAAAIDVLEIFESMVRRALAGYEPPIKWIGDEAMLSFPQPESAIQALGSLLQACRQEPRLPLTRAGLNHGPVIRRANDLFGSTVNVAARIAALASPGQLLATRPIAEAAAARGILVQDLGKVALRSVADEVPLYEIEIAPSPDPAWIDPVCKMHAPYASYRRAVPE